MDTLSLVKNVYDIGSQALSDYQVGKQVRLGNYNGVNNIKQLGHYSKKTGKRLGIYHG